MAKYVAHFSECGLKDIAEIGGKGGNLGELTCAGFPVPPGFCVKVSAFDTFLTHNDLLPRIDTIASTIKFNHLEDVTEKTAQIRDLITSCTIPDSISCEISDAYKDLPGNGTPPLVSVRSSVGTRDLSRSSFPGQMDTFHNLHGVDMVLEYVRKCWASVWSERAAVTVHTKKIDFRSLIIAPLVQLMVPSDTAGVLFTANPVNLRPDEIMINACYGLGESVVSGHITPDHYVIDKKNKEITFCEPGLKKYKIVFNADQGHGNRKIDLSREEAENECLTPDQLEELTDLGIRIEEHYSIPQDVEWAYVDNKLYVLQSRRAVGFDAVDQKPDKEIPLNPEIVWSRKFGDEYLAEYTTPLSFTLLVRWIIEDYLKDMSRLQLRKDLEDIEPIRSYNGYAYVNGLFVARWLRFIPKKYRSMDLMDWFPGIWDERIAAEPFRPWIMFGILWSLFKDPRAGEEKNQIALKTHCENIVSTILPKLTQDYTKLSNEEWMKQFDEAYEFGREHFRIIRWGMGFYNPMFHKSLSKRLEKWAGDTNGEYYQAIISGLPNTHTAEINRHIWQLSMLVRENPQLMSLLRDTDSIYEDLRKASSDDPFWHEFDDFVKQHGHRAATREISQQRWHETPDIIFSLVQAQLQSDTAPPDPETVTQKSIDFRIKIENEAFEKAGRGLLGKWRKRTLRLVFKKTQEYTCYRENQRYYLDYILTHMRQLILEQARRFIQKGVLSDPFEVFFLYKDEFWPLMSQPVPSESLAIKIKERIDHYMEWRDRLPATYLFDDVEVEESMLQENKEPQDSGNKSKGLAASRGIVQGPVRVISQLKHLNKIKAGEILVVNNIDPGWTNVFPLIGGLITETGGLLAHGALLAREYGIPAVMGVTDATVKFKTGEIVQLNGSEGYIIRLNEDAFCS